jgi:Cu2+-containing amine oxidase
MKDRYARQAFVVLLMFCIVVATLSAESPKLITQPKERAIIQEALEKSPSFAEAIKGKKKVIASTMIRYKEKSEGGETESELVETLHFDYDTGKTIRAIYNMTDKKMIKLEKLAAYPTPLTEDELAQARNLAEDKDEKVKALYKKYNKNQVTVEALAPVIADRSNKRFGKRLAILVLTPKEKAAETVTITVNLTDKTVSRE